jgi:hypothetical protein
MIGVLGNYCNFTHLRLDDRRRIRLRVVVLQVALEVQDRQLIRLLQAKELAEGRIGVDLLALHQALLLRVRADALRHRRAGDKGALRDAKELAERIGHGRGAREDRLLLGERRAVLRNSLRLAATAALGGLLHLAGQLLLELLDRRAELADELPGILNLLGQRRELRKDVHDNRRARRGSGLNNGRNNGRRRGGGGNNRRGLGGLGGRGLYGLGGRRGSSGRRIGLLRGTLGGRRSRAHVVILVSEEFFKQTKRTTGGECLTQ